MCRHLFLNTYSSSYSSDETNVRDFMDANAGRNANRKGNLDAREDKHIAKVKLDTPTYVEL